MKFATFAQRGLTAYGAIADQGIIDLSSRHGNTWPTLKHVIEDTALPRLTDLAATLNPDFATTCITFQIQSTFPTATPYMPLFPYFARSFTGHNQPLIRPPESPQLD